MSSDCPVLYHRWFLPNWLRTNATWNSDYEGSDLNLKIKADSANWESVFRVQLLDNNADIGDCDNISVNIVVGVTDYCDVENTMSFLLSDGSFSIGFQLNGVDSSSKERAVIAVEGEKGKILRNVNTDVANAPTGCGSTSTAGEYNLSLVPRMAWGKASAATCDGGTKVVAQYSDCLNVASNGLMLDLYRFKSGDVYNLNYIEVTVYKDSDLVDLAEGLCTTKWSRPAAEVSKRPQPMNHDDDDKDDVDD